MLFSIYGLFNLGQDAGSDGDEAIEDFSNEMRDAFRDQIMAEMRMRDLEENDPRNVASNPHDCIVNPEGHHVRDDHLPECKLCGSSLRKMNREF